MVSFMTFGRELGGEWVAEGIQPRSPRINHPIIMQEVQGGLASDGNGGKCSSRSRHVKLKGPKSATCLQVG